MDRQSAKTNSSVDSWYGIQDPRKRKRIQDRLAQRARRKRLTEAIRNTETSLVVQHGPETLEADLSDETEIDICENMGTGTSASSTLRLSPIQGSVDSSDTTTTIVLRPSYASAWSDFPNRMPRYSTSTRSDTPSPKNSTYLSPIMGYDKSCRCVITCSASSLSSDHQNLKTPKDDLIVALGICGSLLGIVCGIKVQRSSRPASSVPEILHPTPLQLIVPHYSWIDRWPFPRLRDNLILLAQTVRIEELMDDVFIMETCTIKEGHPPWDPTAWKMSAAFREKWGFLFH